MKGVLEYFRPDTVHVVGVATDICVLAAVNGLSDYVNHIILHTDCMKGLSKENEEKAIAEMVALGNVWVEK
jgi:nicotinamidase-related amidase